MRVELLEVRALSFDDGSPVRAASAVAPYGDGWLVAQDDAAHAAWVRPGGVSRLRLVPSVDGHDVFASAAGTKHLKPDLEAACPVDGGVLLLGSGSTAARMRAVLVRPQRDPVVTDLAPLYERVAQALDRPLEVLNLEGACRLGESLRWYARGVAGLPSASVDVPLADLLGALAGEQPPLPLSGVRTYDLGTVDGVGLDVTDAVALPDGRVLVSAAAEDTPNVVDDGPVVGSALALLDGDRVVARVELPRLAGEVAKVEGLALLAVRPDGAELLAVVDDDDPGLPSAQLRLDVRWG